MGKIKIIVKRPLSHYFIITAYVLAPVVNILLVRVIGGIPYDLIIRNFFRGFGLFTGVWLITAPIIGIGIYFVSKTSWYLFIGHSSLIIIVYFVKWFYNPVYYIRTISGSYNVIMLAGNIILIIIVGYIIQKDFRAPYFQTLQRHWRENTRIPIHHMVTINGIQMNIDDLSPGGCFVLKPDKDFTIDGDYNISFQSDLLHISCKGHIMRQTDTGYGIMFNALSLDQKKDIKRFLKKRFALRRQIKMDAQWLTEEKTKDVLLIDISAGGCFVAADVDKVREGDHGVLKINSNGNPHNVHGQITWLNHKGEHNKPEGFGLSFRLKQKHLLKKITEKHGKLDFTR